MWPNPQETADLVTLVKKSLMENFFFVQWHVLVTSMRKKWETAINA